MIESINNRVAVDVNELNGILAYSTLAKLVQRRQVERARRPAEGVPALYYVDSLPLRYKTEVYKRIPDANAQAEAQPFTEKAEIDGAAINFFEGYTMPDGSYLPEEKVVEYSNNAAVLNAFRAWLEESNSTRRKQGHRQVKMGEFWAKAASLLDRFDNFPNTLPRNPRRLQDKFNQYLREGYTSLINGRLGNGNASKVASEQQKALITALCAMPNGFDNQFIAARYNELAEQSGWEKISAGTVAKHRKESGLFISHVRYGNTHFSNTAAMQVQRSRPTGAMLLWSLDGWDAELYYQKRNAKGVVTYTNRKVLEVVIDPCCDYPIGYAIGDREDASLIAEALRNAANHTRELFGRRYRTCQIQSDHFAMSSMSPYYATVADKVTPARVKNAKSKPVERYFLSLNETYCKTQRNWSGYGITAGKNNQPSAEWLNVNKKMFPDEEGVIRQLETIIAQERARKHDEYMKFWEQTAEEHRLPLADEAFLLRFGQTTGYTNTLEGAGLRPRIEGHRHSYDSFDLRFRELGYLKWEVRYDPADLSHVLAVSEDGKQRFMLEEKYVQPMALADRKEGDMEQLMRIGQFNQDVNLKHQLQFAEVAKHAAPLLGGKMYEELETPDAHNDLAKAVITDSKGQHKLNRAEERKQITAGKRERNLVPVEIVVENAPAGAQRIETFDLY